MTSPREVGQRVAGRIRFYRRARELTVRGLAAECARLGLPEMTEQCLWNVESRGRRVSVPELMVLAQALRVPPLMLVSTPASMRCGRCGQAPPAGFTCNSCGRATVTPDKGSS